VSFVVAPLVLGGLMTAGTGWLSLRSLNAARGALEQRPRQLTLRASRSQLWLVESDPPVNAREVSQPHPVAMFGMLLWSSPLLPTGASTPVEVYGDPARRGPLVAVGEPGIVLGRGHRYRRSGVAHLFDSVATDTIGPLGPFMGAATGSALAAYGLIAAGASAAANILSLFAPFSAELVVAFSGGAWLGLIFYAMALLARSAIRRAVMAARLRLLPGSMLGEDAPVYLWSNSIPAVRAALAAVATTALALLLAILLDQAPPNGPVLHLVATVATIMLVGTALLIACAVADEERQRRATEGCGSIARQY
jgi:hypothetical protein